MLEVNDFESSSFCQGPFGERVKGTLCNVWGERGLSWGGNHSSKTRLKRNHTRPRTTWNIFSTSSHVASGGGTKLIFVAPANEVSLTEVGYYQVGGGTSTGKTVSQQVSLSPSYFRHLLGQGGDRNLGGSKHRQTPKGTRVSGKT